MNQVIVVGLDGSPLAEKALPYAEIFAKAMDAEVVLVRAVHAEGASAPLPNENPHLLPYMVVMPGTGAEKLTEEERSAVHGAERYLDQVAQRLGDRGVRAQGVEVAGDPTKVLVEEAEARGASMILLTTHGRSGLGRWLYGSVAEAVVAHSRIPVLLTRAWTTHGRLARADGRPKLLVPLDGSARAETAVPVAAKLAKSLAVDVHLVEIVPALGEWEIGDEAWLYDDPKDFQKDEEKEASEYIRTVKARLEAEGVTVTSTVRIDSVGAGIAASAATNQAALVVMATSAPTALGRTLVGSTAHEVLHRANLPVLLIGPAYE
jgi:nucleotide-binding universal stress UspA family protein